MMNNFLVRYTRTFEIEIPATDFDDAVQQWHDLNLSSREIEVATDLIEITEYNEHGEPLGEIMY